MYRKATKVDTRDVATQTTVPKADGHPTSRKDEQPFYEEVVITKRRAACAAPNIPDYEELV